MTNKVETTEQQIVDLMEEVCAVDRDLVTSISHLEDDLGLDSLDRTELNMAMETKFGISIPDDDFDELMTVQKIVAYVDQNKH